MQEFTSVSVSSYEADSLTALLNEKSGDGWDVVAIVPTGSTVTGYLSRQATGDTTRPDDTETSAPASEPAIAAAVLADTTVVDEPEVESDVDSGDPPTPTTLPTRRHHRHRQTPHRHHRHRRLPDVARERARLEPGRRARRLGDRCRHRRGHRGHERCHDRSRHRHRRGRASRRDPSPLQRRPTAAQPRPVGTPILRRATSCATGTAGSGPSTCHAPVSSSPIRPSLSDMSG